MKLPFGKKKLKLAGKPASGQTLQDMQKEFNEHLFRIGEAKYKIFVVQEELNRLNSDINMHAQKADKLSREAAIVRERMQQEVMAKVKEGESKKDAELAATTATPAPEEPTNAG